MYPEPDLQAGRLGRGLGAPQNKGPQKMLSSMKIFLNINQIAMKLFHSDFNICIDKNFILK